MLPLIGVTSALLVYTLAGLLFDLAWGLPVRKGALTRQFRLIASAAPTGDPRRVSAILQSFLYPPEVRDRAGFTRALLLTALAGFAVGRLVFGSLWIGALLTLTCVPYRYYLVRMIRRQRLELLNLQFKDALGSIASALRAGASLPSAVERSLDDLRRVLHGQAEQPIIDELDRMVREMRLGGSVEDALVRFRDRVRLEDVDNFVNAALLCKARGGNLAEVMATVAQIISDKVDVRRQIQVLTAGKRLEANLLTAVPFVIVSALAVLSPDYMVPLFTRLDGQLLAALGVVLLVAAYFIGRKVVEIEV